MPGGGQNDLWHGLTCKGKYAGDIRIELTYYDTRPKEEVPAELASTAQDIERSRDGLSGPRQPKPVKRRPLPADPTSTTPSPRPIHPEHAHSSPLPYTPTHLKQHGHVPQSHSGHRSVDYSRHQPYIHPSPQFDQEARSSPIDVNSNNHQAYDAYSEPIPGVGQQHVLHHNKMPQSQHQQEDADFLDYQASYPTEPRNVLQSSNYGPMEEFYQGQSPLPFSRPDYSLPQRHSMLNANELASYQETLPMHYGSSPPQFNAYVPRHQSIDDNYQAQSDPFESRGEDEGPPPPPIHRNSDLGIQSHHQERTVPENYHRAVAPPPLNIRHARGSVSASPLSQVHSNSAQDDCVSSVSPTTGPLSRKSASSVSSLTSYSQPSRYQSHDSAMSPYGRNPIEQMPPSLVPGYDPSVADLESDRIINEKLMDARQTSNVVPTPTYVRSPIHEVKQRYSLNFRSEGQNSRYEIENTQEPRVHRASVPVVKPRPISPDSRAPMRKSLSPQPEPMIENRLSGIPFSPDSYDSLNPNLKASSSVNKPGPKYETPDQAKDASRQHEQEEKVDDGPIIGSDGRVIDPSDHLPTHTWAPEPEQKPPRRGPEVTLKFKHTPRGAQPMPLASRQKVSEDNAARSHSNSSPIHPTAGPYAPITPTTATRNRLQKKTRASPAQPYSSPIVPTINTEQRPMPRASASAYPLRERPNYGYGSSPDYARFSPSGPPPIPAKVPIAKGQEDWGTSALSEEMSRIDIGVGSGSGRTRRSRYGA